MAIKDLPDLQKQMQDCKNVINGIRSDLAVSISPSQWEKIHTACEQSLKGEDIKIVGGHTLVTSRQGKFFKYVSCQEFPKLFALIPYVDALKSYLDALDELAKSMGFTGRKDKHAKEIFEKLPDKDWFSNKIFDGLKKAIPQVFPEEIDRERISHFISDPKWSGLGEENGGEGRSLARNDIIESGVLKVGGFTAAAAAGRTELIEVFKITGITASELELLDGSSLKSHQNESASGLVAIPGGKNTIYYGAPGTGKSYKVDQIVGAAGTGTVVRTVFHPDTQNSDFAGCLKPVTSDGSVTYAFSPGPFARALVNAVRDPQKMHYLVIEELNRAPAAAVFGELFLLLDRDENGLGQYDVDFPSEEFRKWWGHETGDNAATKLRLPSNLSIIATMNSADQGVFPLDTAFRRRWEQHYMKIDPQQAHEAGISYVGSSDTAVTVSWKIFVGKLNDFLVNDLGGNISEDRLVGHYFLSKADLPDTTTNEIPGKLLIYLWDDLLRHHGRDILFDKTIKSYGELSSRIRDNRTVFSRKFLDSLPAAAPAEPAA